MSTLDIVVVYTADGCDHCAALRRDFERRRVDHTEVNLSRQPQRLDELRQLVWDRRLPVIVDHERISIGFNGRSTSLAALGLDD